MALACVGVGAWFAWGRGAPQANAGSQPVIQPTASEAPSSQQAEGSAEPSSTTASSPTVNPATPSGPASPSGPVTVAEEAATSASGTQVAAFLDEYFNAINAHDYSTYAALLTAAAQLSQSQFDKGYGSTTDSGETLRSISTTADGDVIAHVAFTSHQSATDSPSDSACTAWTISLYLKPADDGYLIDNPPSGYHAGFTACG